MTKDKSKTKFEKYIYPKTQELKKIAKELLKRKLYKTQSNQTIKNAILSKLPSL